MNQNKELLNIFVAIFLSALTIFVWNIVFPKPNYNSYDKVNSFDVKSDIPVEEKEVDLLQRKDAIAKSGKRFYFENDNIKGSVLLKGAIIDDISLVKYKKNISNDSDSIYLLSPKNTKEHCFVEFGWVVKDAINPIFLPNKETEWFVEQGSKINNFTMFWDNKHGLKFTINVKLDDKYMLDITQKVYNSTNQEINISSYALMNKNIDFNANLSEGPKTNEGLLVGVDNSVINYGYKKLIKKHSARFIKKNLNNKKNNWVGFSDKYWLSAFVVPSIVDYIDVQAVSVSSSLMKSQISFASPNTIIANGESHAMLTNLFTGAKELNTLDMYSKKYNISFFDKALDFGLFYFITKPLLIILQYLHKLINSFGLAIIFLTIFVKILMTPLSVKAYVASQNMKKLQPRIKLIQDQYANDKVRLNSEMVILFKQTKTNPISGCLPFLIQIPIFIALYKVFIVSIDMRHQPFFWWIVDLSAKDPVNMLFFLKKINIPYLNNISIGILPVALTITMVLQQKITGTSTSIADKNQENAIKLMPYFFLFIFASFPSGLLIYWICSNILSILQHILMTKLYGK